MKQVILRNALEKRTGIPAHYIHDGARSKVGHGLLAG
jgi:hypothetical protein